MELDQLSLHKSKVSFAKVVAPPTPQNWSQAYNAGTLYAVLSLSHGDNDPTDLGAVGKEILDTLEEEFFSLELKNLASIKTAVLTTIEKIPQNLSSSFLVASIQKAENTTHETVLYTFLKGTGKILIKRGERFGSILVSSDIPVASSGFLQDGDLIILETQRFADIIPVDYLKDTLDHHPPQEIAETLAPKILSQAEGGACAIIMSYTNPPRPESTEELSEEIPSLPTPSIPLQSIFSELLKKIKPSVRSFIAAPSLPFSGSRRMLLGIVVGIGIILAAGIFLTIQSQQNKKNRELFDEIYQEADKKYQEGQSLLPLNKNLARDDFDQAEKIVIAGEPKLQKGSDEDKKLSDFLKKIQDAKGQASATTLVVAKEVDKNQSPLLSTYFKDSKTSFVATDEKNIYLLNDSGISASDKSSGKTSVVVKKADAWKDAGGLGAYGNNLYVLDKSASQVLKFTPVEGGGYGKTNYLAKDVTPDFSNAVSVGIDGSLYVLFKNGSISKFNRGQSQKFTVSGLDTQFSNPKRITTSVDDNNIYILDTGNSRIVVLNKEGAYASQYKADVIKQAVDFDVVEKDKKIFVLSQNKIYEIDIK